MSPFAKSCFKRLLSTFGLLLLAGCYKSVGCVVEGTRIATPAGPVAIESLKVGDQVWSRSAVGEMVPGTVASIRSAVADQIIEIHTDDGCGLSTTADHPLAANGGWLVAGSLSGGMKVDTVNGPVEIKRVSHRRGRWRVFDLSIAAHENFFAQDILVHNKTVPRRPTASEMHGTWLGMNRHGEIYRLVLNDGGTGELARVRVYRGKVADVERLTLESWTLDEYSLAIVAQEHFGDSTRNLKVYGTAYEGELRLRHSRNPRNSREVDLVVLRESDFMNAAESLAQQMDIRTSVPTSGD